MNYARAAIGGVVAVPLILLLGYGMRHDPRAIPSPLPGRAAPDFALSVFRVPKVGVDGPAVQGGTLQVGDTVRLAEKKGGVVVLNFWASWCLACRDEHTALSEVASEYSDADVHFYGVLYNDNADNGRRWIEQMGGQRYPSLDDPGSRTAIDYGLYGVPETFFISPDGRVARKFVGPVTTQVLRDEIEKLRREGEPVREGQR